MKGVLERLIAFLFILGLLFVYLGLTMSVFGSGSEVIEVHPGSGGDVTDFIEISAGDLCSIKRIEWGGAGYDFPTPVIVNGAYVPFGDGMSAFSGVDVPGMDLPFGGPARRIKFICVDDTIVIDFNYGSGSGVVYDYQKSGYKKITGGWGLTPALVDNRYGVGDYATPGRPTVESPTAVALTNFQVLSQKASVELNVLVVAFLIIVLVSGGFSWLIE